MSISLALLFLFCVASADTDIVLRPGDQLSDGRVIMRDADDRTVTISVRRYAEWRRRFVHAEEVAEVAAPQEDVAHVEATDVAHAAGIGRGRRTVTILMALVGSASVMLVLMLLRRRRNHIHSIDDAQSLGTDDFDDASIIWSDLSSTHRPRTAHPLPSFSIRDNAAYESESEDWPDRKLPECSSPIHDRVSLNDWPSYTDTDTDASDAPFMPMSPMARRPESVKW
jgi:hypothetical protein